VEKDVDRPGVLLLLERPRHGRENLGRFAASAALTLKNSARAPAESISPVIRSTFGSIAGGRGGRRRCCAPPAPAPAPRPRRNRTRRRERGPLPFSAHRGKIPPWDLRRSGNGFARRARPAGRSCSTRPWEPKLARRGVDTSPPSGAPAGSNANRTSSARSTWRTPGRGGRPDGEYLPHARTESLRRRGAAARPSRRPRADPDGRRARPQAAAASAGAESSSPARSRLSRTATPRPSSPTTPPSRGSTRRRPPRSPRRAATSSSSRR